MNQHQQWLAISGVLVSVWIGIILFRNLVKRNHIAVSWRNLFLLGVAFFQGFGAYYETVTDGGHRWYVPQDGAYITLAIITPLFLGVFLLCAMFSYRWTWPQKFLPKIQLPMTTPMVIAAIGVLLFASVAAAITVPRGYLSGFFTVFKSGFGSAAFALATYLFLSRKKNPVAWGVFLGTLAVASVVATVGESGRRGVLSVFMAGGWMWFFHTLRYKRVPGTLLKVGAVACLAIVFLSMYNTVRGTGGRESLRAVMARAEQFTALFQRGAVHTNQIQGMFYTDTTINTLFVIDNYPERYPYIAGNGAGLFFGMPIPRFIWADKPKGLGYMLQFQMNVPANLGPGIIGHGWAEGALIGVFGYAIFFGLLLGAMDRAITDRSWNPYFIAATGASLGNVFALPRGETSIFMALIVAAFIGTWLLLTFSKLVFGPILGAISLPMPALGEGMGPRPEHVEAWDEADPGIAVVDPELAASYSDPALSPARV